MPSLKRKRKIRVCMWTVDLMVNTRCANGRAIIGFCVVWLCLLSRVFFCLLLATLLLLQIVPLYFFRLPYHHINIHQLFSTKVPWYRHHQGKLLYQKYKLCSPWAVVPGTGYSLRILPCKVYFRSVLHFLLNNSAGLQQILLHRTWRQGHLSESCF